MTSILIFMMINYLNPNRPALLMSTMTQVVSVLRKILKLGRERHLKLGICVHQSLRRLLNMKEYNL